MGEGEKWEKWERCEKGERWKKFFWDLWFLKVGIFYWKFGAFWRKVLGYEGWVGKNLEDDIAVFAFIAVDTGREMQGRLRGSDFTCAYACPATALYMDETVDQAGLSQCRQSQIRGTFEPSFSIKSVRADSPSGFKQLWQCYGCKRPPDNLDSLWQE